MTLRRTRIKFCGITRLEDALAATALGVDAIGFVCVPASRRFVAPAEAARIRRRLPPLVSVVLLVSNAEVKTVSEAVSLIRPDVIQFHGHESRAFCEWFGQPYWKAVGVRDAADIRNAALDHPSAQALLLDRHSEEGMGGTGQRFDWAAVPRTVELPLILAGGLLPGNVGQAVRMVAPYAVDVSSGIELSPGRKDPEKMQAFVAAVRQADADSKP